MDRIIDIYVRMFEFDAWVFSQWWLYAPLGMPAMFYLAFFGMKWSVLTMPLWLPFNLILQGLSRRNRN